MTESPFMLRAIQLSYEGMRAGFGGPFGAVVVRNGEILGEGSNRVLVDHDPSAHAEVTAIRAACSRLGQFELIDCELFTSCEPCPMCLGAIYWARIGRVHYANTRADAHAVGFDDDRIYQQLGRPLEQRDIEFHRSASEQALGAFREWQAMEDKTTY